MDLNDAIAELISVHVGPGMGIPFEPLDFANETTGRAFATVIATILNAVPSGQLIPLETTEAAIAAGWNACRLSVYAVCEDIQDREAEEITDQGDHAQGYKRGLKRAAKSIARGFGAMEALDDDGVRTAIAALKGADNG